MDKKIRIALITDGIYPFMIGGMQKHSYYLTKQFLSRGVDLTLFHCIQDKIEDNVVIKREIINDLENRAEYNLKIYTYKFPKMNFYFPGHYLYSSYLYSKLVYNDLIKEKPYDFIYSKGFSCWYTLNNKIGLAPIGVQFHGLEMFQANASIKNIFENLILRTAVKINVSKADYIFTYGGKIKNLLRFMSVPESKIQIQYGGVEPSNLINERSIKELGDKRKFLFIGRNEKRKGYKLLKKAIYQLPSTLLFEFGFIGPVSKNDKIQRDEITYFGQVNSAEKYYTIIDQYDVLVVPSISEGLPTVILEAMSRGLAIIATDVGAIEDLVSSNNGILIPPNDTEAIKKSIEVMINMKPKELKIKKYNSLLHIKKNFLWAGLIDNILNFIKKVKNKW